MKTIYKLISLFLAVVFAACHNDNQEDPPTSDGLKIVDGWIVSPEWLTQKVEEIGNSYNISPGTELPPYPQVYGIKHNGEDYIYVFDPLDPDVVSGRMFFTISGEPVEPGPAPLTNDGSLYDELIFSENKILLWDTSRIGNQTRSSISTPGTMQIIYTPNGSPVDVLVGYEEFNTPEDIAYELGKLRAAYPNAEILSNPTTTYNCHGYAWHMSEGGSPVSIGTKPMIYIEDGSYIPTSSTTPNAKVMYRSDHSAIAETPDVFVSKWGGWPLMRHNKNYSPYISSGLTYYKRNVPLEITGPDKPAINTPVSYSVPTAQDITFNNWEITPNSFTTTSGLNSRNLAIKFTSAATYTLKAIFNLPNGNTYTATKTVNVTSSTPPPTITSITVRPRSIVGPGSMVVFTANGTNLEYATIEWTVSGGLAGSTETGNPFTTYTLHGYSSGKVTCKAYSAGGTSRSLISSVTIQPNGPVYAPSATEEEN